MILAICTLFTALAISAVAAFYSIVGLMAIFSASAMSIAVMGIVLEVGKLITASFKVNFLTYWSFFMLPIVYLFRKLRGACISSDKPSSDFQIKIPSFVDNIFRFFSKIELYLLKRQLSLPIGVSLFGTARKA